MNVYKILTVNGCPFIPASGTRPWPNRVTDFDEATPAPAARELTRMVTSICVALNTMGIAPAESIEYASQYANHVKANYDSYLAAYMAGYFGRM